MEQKKNEGEGVTRKREGKEVKACVWRRVGVNALLTSISTCILPLLPLLPPSTHLPVGSPCHHCLDYITMT